MSSIKLCAICGHGKTSHLTKMCCAVTNKKELKKNKYSGVYEKKCRCTNFVEKSQTERKINEQNDNIYK